MRKDFNIKNQKWFGGLGLISALLIAIALWTDWFGLWVALGIILISSILLKNSTQIILNFMARKWWIKWPVYFVAVFLLAIFCRVFLFEVYNIPSGSMRNTLLPGDKIIVNKLIYGPELPASLHEVPWLNVFASGKTESEQAGSTRLQGIDSIRRNDVVVFDHPAQHNVYVKRCVGLPGEHIRISGEKLLVEGERKETPKSVLHEYRIYASRVGEFDKLAEKKDLRVFYLGDSIRYVNISGAVRKELMESSLVDSLKLMTERLKKRCYSKISHDNEILFSKTAQSRFFSSDSSQKRQWSGFDFGPLYIPKKGERIRLNTKNVEIYRDVIVQHEGHSLKIKGDTIYIDHKRRNSYEFKNDYYFMLGDNRCNSMDSRFWGFVPKDHIIGKATSVLFSFANGTMKRKRILKDIN